MFLCQLFPSDSASSFSQWTWGQSKGEKANEKHRLVILLVVVKEKANEEGSVISGCGKMLKLERRTNTTSISRFGQPAGWLGGKGLLPLLQGEGSNLWLYQLRIFNVY